MYKFGVSILFIVVNLFFLDLSFSKEKINHSINGTIDFQLQKVIFDGVTVYKREELISLIRPLIAKNPDFNSKKLQEEVKLAIHKKYIQDGYAGSFAYKVSYNKKKGTLNIFALEGRVSSFYIPKEALRIKYVREYADKILNMRIFNMKEAKPYFVHLRNILGSGSDFHINLLDKLDEKDISKTIDIFYAIDAKYKGVFSIHNYRTPDEHTENVFKDTELLTRGNYFTMGDLVIKVRNPWNTPSNMNVGTSTSGDKKENKLFLTNEYQINRYGTNFTTVAMIDQLNFHVKKKLKMFQIGIQHPIFFSNNSHMKLSAKLEHNSFSFTPKKASEPLIPIQGRSYITNKIILGNRIANVTSKGHVQIYDFSYHMGKSKKKYFDSKESHNMNYQKLVFNTEHQFDLPKDLKLNLNIDGQYANSIIPDTETYSPALTNGGKGLFYLNVAARNAITGVAQLSQYKNVDSQFLVGFDKYVYYEHTYAKKRKDGDINGDTNKQKLEGAYLSSIGAGVDLYTVDKLVVNFELNQRLTQKNYSKDIKKLQFFAGLRYYFSF